MSLSARYVVDSSFHRVPMNMSITSRRCLALVGCYYIATLRGQLLNGSFIFMLYLTLWGGKPVVTHPTSWLESTGVCGVRQNQAS